VGQQTRVDVVTYTLQKTSLADPQASVLIPDLRIQVGKEPISQLYAYTIEFAVPQGPTIEQAQVGIFFPRKVHIYGKTTEVPSPLHSIACDPSDNGLRCNISSLSKTTARGIRIILATDEKDPPTVEMIAKDAELMSSGQFFTERSHFWSRLDSSDIFGIVLGILLIPLTAFQTRVLRGFRSRTVVVGKVMDADGRPITNAEVEVKLESPNHTYAPTQTDHFGDFVLGGLSKLSLLKGRIRVTHPNFVSSESEFDSPIVIQKLARNP
jgi:hypothetical protein